MECKPPDRTDLIVIDYCMIVIAGICMIIAFYGLYRYVENYLNTNQKPSKPLFITGLAFFIISIITLINALLYDIFFLFCPILDVWEGPIYHSIYFVQIYTLWLVLFTRLHHVFKGSIYRLSQISIIAYYFSFISVAVAIIPMYIIFHLEAESFITLPYVSLSILFSINLLIAFIYKLMHLFHDMTNSDDFTMKSFKDQRQSNALLSVMTKHTLLAVISISCTFLVIFVLLYLYVQHKGYHEKHTIFEEFVLEFAILIDIVSNFLCVLLSYQFFDAQYRRCCKCCNKRLNKCFHLEIQKELSKKSSIHLHIQCATSITNASSNINYTNNETNDETINASQH